MQAFNRGRQVNERTSGRQETLVRILGVYARLQRVTAHSDLLLGKRQRLAGGDSQLPFHQIEAGNQFGHWVFHL
jgi:hypothetical protein